MGFLLFAGVVFILGLIGGGAYFAYSRWKTRKNLRDQNGDPERIAQAKWKDEDAMSNTTTLVEGLRTASSRTHGEVKPKSSWSQKVGQALPGVDERQGGQPPPYREDDKSRWSTGTGPGMSYPNYQQALQIPQPSHQSVGYTAYQQAPQALPAAHQPRTNVANRAPQFAEATGTVRSDKSISRNAPSRAAAITAMPDMRVGRPEGGIQEPKKKKKTKERTVGPSGGPSGSTPMTNQAMAHTVGPAEGPIKEKARSPVIQVQKTSDRALGRAREIDSKNLMPAALSIKKPRSVGIAEGSDTCSKSTSKGRRNIPVEDVVKAARDLAPKSTNKISVEKNIDGGEVRVPKRPTDRSVDGQSRAPKEKLTAKIVDAGKDQVLKREKQSSGSTKKLTAEVPTSQEYPVPAQKHSRRKEPELFFDEPRSEPGHSLGDRRPHKEDRYDAYERGPEMECGNEFDDSESRMGVESDWYDEDYHSNSSYDFDEDDSQLDSEHDSGHMDPHRHAESGVHHRGHGPRH
jgi:hypothetical protein